MEKQKDSPLQRLFWMVLTLTWIIAAVAVPGAAAEQKESPGEAIGGAARQVTEESRSAYQSTKEAVVKTSKKVAKDAKNAFRETKAAGSQVVKDVKAGFGKEQPAPADRSPEKSD